MVKEMNTFCPKTMVRVRVFMSSFFVASQLLNSVAEGQTENRDRKDKHSQNYAQVSDKEQKQLFGLWILTFKPAFKVPTMLGNHEQTISITIDVQHGQAVSGHANWNYTSPHDGLETVSALVEGSISEEQKIRLAIISPILKQQGQDAKYLKLDGHFVSSSEITGQVFPGTFEQKKTYLRVPLPQGGSFKLNRSDATALVTQPAG